MSARRKSLLWSTSGAVAPTVALSLFGLIAAGGIAFDYARMAGMDTELQSAADQAALAAASQLDGSSTAITRATSAAQTLIVNQTRFANDRDSGTGQLVGRSIGVSSTLTFYSVYNADTDSGTTTTDAKVARFVQVSVNAREAVYALTPVVGLFKSGSIGALATAGLSSAVCKVPPLMLCIPSETFPSNSDIGIGLKLQPGPKTGAWVAGDYGYLDFANGASGLATNLAANSEAVGCFENSGGIETEPGNKASVTKALNTRFDLYDSGVNSCNSTSGDYCPGENVGKDFARKEEVAFRNVSTGSAPPNPGCGATDGTGPNGPKVTVTDFQQYPAAKGFTRDTCHTPAGSPQCTGKFGNGTWDVAGYFAANHPSDTVPSGVAAHRYNVYNWELQNKSERLPSKLLNPGSAAVPSNGGGGGSNGGGGGSNGGGGGSNGGGGGSGNVTYTYTNYCAYPQPKNGTAVVAGPNQKDRRVLTVAAVDCTGLNGKGAVKVKRWVDVFLVEPSTDRTSPYPTEKSEIYVEIIGEATKPGGANAFQYYGRNRPYLLK